MTSDAVAGSESAPLIALARRWRLLLWVPLATGLVTLAICFVIPPQFTGRTSFLPPQQQQNQTALAANAALGALSNLLGSASGGSRTPIDQYVSLVKSTTVADKLIDKFDLRKVYDEELRVDARKILARRTDVVSGKKDGLIIVEVDDVDRERAAAMANQYVDELRTLTSRLALTEAQTRRAFFEALLERNKEQLIRAQLALQGSGFNLESLKAEPKATADTYAKLKAELTVAQARLQALRQNLTDNTPEVRQLQATIGVLSAQLSRVESANGEGSSPDYVGKYREFKYQEALFEQLARQFETARVDEAREGGLIQVVDVALPPEKKSFPLRALTSAAVWLATLLVVIALVVSTDGDPAEPGRTWRRLRAAMARS